MGTRALISHLDGDLAYLHNGITDGTPVVFLHGFSDMAECWTPFIARLDLDLPVYALDAPGHGRSRLHAAPDPMSQLVERAITFLSELGRPAIVMGHSMGAVQAMYVACDAPELVRALVLEDPPMTHTMPQWDNHATAIRLGDGVRRTTARDVDEVIAEVRAGNPHWDADEADPMVRSKWFMDLNFLDAFDIHRESMTQTLTKLTSPALLLTGDTQRNAIITEDTAQWAVGLCPSMRLAHFPGTTHQIHRDAAADVTRVVCEFILEHT